MSLPIEKAIVRRLVDEVQTGGDFAVFDELMDPDFIDHTPAPGFPPTRDGARHLYQVFRSAFPDMVANIDFQTGEVDLVTTRKTYKGTHQREFLGVPATGRAVHFDVIDVLRVRNGRITEHWGVMNIAALMQQLTSGRSRFIRAARAGAEGRFPGAFLPPSAGRFWIGGLGPVNTTAIHQR